MDEHPLILGIDPGVPVEGDALKPMHTLALLLSNPEMLLAEWAEFQLLQHSTWPVDGYLLQQRRHRKRLVIVIEWPEYQGPARGGKDFASVLKQAARLLMMFQLCPPAAIYTPPARIIRKQHLGKANPTDAEILAWCIDQGYPCGRGTDLNNPHKRDALLAALWGRWLLDQPKQHHADWREPRT